jgi:hypothetical protein
VYKAIIFDNKFLHFCVWSSITLAHPIFHIFYIIMKCPFLLDYMFQLILSIIRSISYTSVTACFCIIKCFLLKSLKSWKICVYYLLFVGDVLIPCQWFITVPLFLVVVCVFYVVLMVSCRVLVWSCAHGGVSCIFHRKNKNGEHTRMLYYRNSYMFPCFHHVWNFPKIKTDPILGLSQFWKIFFIMRLWN